MSSVPIGSLDARIANVGLLLGVLQGTPADLNLDLDWFANPLPALEHMPQDTTHLLAVLRAFLGSVAPDAPTDREWYALNWTDENGTTVESGIYVVLPLASASGTATVGVGVGRTFAAKDAAYPIGAWGYVPLFEIPVGSPFVVTGTADHPIELRLTIEKNGGPFTVPGTTFTGIAFTSDVTFSGAPTFALEFLNQNPPGAPITTLERLRDATVGQWLNAVLAATQVKAWLATPIASTKTTIGAVLADLGLLVAGSGGSYTVGDFSRFVGKSALQVAQQLLSEALKVIASATAPIVKLGTGGLYVVGTATPDGTATDYGLRLQVPTVDLSPSDPNAPRLTVVLGDWLPGDTATDNWYTRSNADDKPGDLGVTVRFVRVQNAAPNAISFVVSVDLVSLGFDFAGANDRPLVAVQGVRLGGISPRFALALDGSSPRWAVGTRIDNLALPVGNGLSGAAASNPIAQNLLSSGGGSGDTEAINPAFSLAASKVVAPSHPFAVQLYDADGNATDTVWLPVQRAFGPLALRRLGVEWPQPPDLDDPRLAFLFDASVMLSILEVDLQGLRVGIPLANPGTLGDYDFGLDGLAVSFESGPLSVLGGLVKQTVQVGGAPTIEYNGAAVVKAATWSLGAIGSYASLGGTPSLFVFAQYDGTIGGPAFFFVTGLCAGFGYNRSLTIPDQNHVPSFPLLSGIADPSTIGGPNASPAQALAAMGEWVQPAQGVNWFAAGVQFTSFELVQSNAVLAVIAGGDFELALLGVSRLKLPQQGTKQYAYVELGLKVELKPSQGFFGASAVISPNSYVITPDCHLTGGFAFYLWFDGPHAGDFVVTIGGYHPAFTKPAWYPDEPRLGFSWQVDGNVSISGSAYFALTPSCVMGGGALDVQFHSGDLRAWFTAHADFLFHWKPYYFTGSVGVSIGASYRVNLLFCSFTISVELGADLEVYGPPTGGTVSIDWYIISFSIPFGAGRGSGPSYVPWSDASTGGFRALLPQNDPAAARKLGALAAGDDQLVNVCTTSIAGGLVTLVDDRGTNPAADGKRWLVRANGLAFGVESAFPLTKVQTQTPSGSPVVLNAPNDPSYYVAIKPMGVGGSGNSVSSVLTLTLTGPDGVNDLSNHAAWSFAATTRDVPEALWGTPPATVNGSVPTPTLPQPGEQTLPDRLVGLGTITPLAPPLTGPPVFPLDNLAYAPINSDDADYLPLGAETPVARQPVVTTDSLRQIAQTIATSAVATRGKLFAALGQLGVNAGANGTTADLAASVDLSYPDPPMLGAPWKVAA
jgi:hypothetical protein